MPLIQFIDKQDFAIGIWRVEVHEYNADFTKILHPNYHANSETYKSIKRKTQIHATKLLFEQMLPGEELSLNNNSKPIIKNNSKHVSIAHTNNIIAMIIAKFPCGIDIEKEDRDTTNIKHKYLNKSDFTTGDNHSNSLINWCAKEVLFKIKGDKSIYFNNHLTIKKNGPSYTGYCNHPKYIFKSNIKIINFKDYCLAFNTNFN